MISDDVIARAMEMRNAGLGWKFIGRHLNIDHTTLRVAVHRAKHTGMRQTGATLCMDPDRMTTRGISE